MKWSNDVPLHCHYTRDLYAVEAQQPTTFDVHGQGPQNNLHTCRPDVDNVDAMEQRLDKAQANRKFAFGHLQNYIASMTITTISLTFTKMLSRLITHLNEDAVVLLMDDFVSEIGFKVLWN